MSKCKHTWEDPYGDFSACTKCRATGEDLLKDIAELEGFLDLAAKLEARRIKRIGELEAEVDRHQKLLMLANSQLTNEAREWCRAKAERMGLLESGGVVNND